MCKFLIAKIGADSDRPKIQRLIQYNLDELATERSGYSVYNGVTKNYPETTDYTPARLKKSHKLGAGNIFMTHFRTATAGDMGAGGLHLTDARDGWIFCHNGWISNYQSVSDKSDSYYFFRNLLKVNPDLDFDGITQVSQKKGFSGRAVLYHPDSDKLVLIAGTFPIHITVVGKSLLFSTFKLINYRKEWVKKNVMGLSWFREIQTDKILVKHRDSKTNYLARFDSNGLTDEKDVKLSTVYPPTPYTWTTKGQNPLYDDRYLLDERDY